MKKFLPFLSLALFTALIFSACSNKPDADAQAAAALQQQQNSINPDTAGLSQFQAWKAQNELADVEEFNQPEQYASAPVVKKTKPVYKAPAPKAPIKQAPVQTVPEASTNTSSESIENVSSGNGDVASSESAGEAEAPAKKGISKAAKGAVIGGVVGAVGGAIINKDNRVVGAVIGGVIGAGGGYGVGRGMDKKDGRYLIN